MWRHFTFFYFCFVFFLFKCTWSASGQGGVCAELPRRNLTICWPQNCWSLWRPAQCGSGQSTDRSPWKCEGGIWPMSVCGIWNASIGLFSHVLVMSWTVKISMMMKKIAGESWSGPPWVSKPFLLLAVFPCLQQSPCSLASPRRCANSPCTRYFGNATEHPGARAKPKSVSVQIRKKCVCKDGLHTHSPDNVWAAACVGHHHHYN